MVFILGLFALENFSRKKAQYHSSTKGGFKSKSINHLTGYKATIAFSFCMFVFFVSFLFPVLQMLYWTIIFPKHLTDLNIIDLFLKYYIACIFIKLCFNITSLYF